MPLSLSVLSSDLDFILTDLPAPVQVTVTVNRNNYVGSKAQLSQEIVYEDRGSDIQYMFTVYMNKDNILEADIPEEDTIILINDVEYRVIRKSLDTIEQLYRIDLGQKYVG